MKSPNSFPISRRNFLQMAMLLVGGGLLSSCSKLSASSPTTVITGDKIKNIIILLQENHSFDSLFAAYPGANGESASNICPNAIHNTIQASGQTAFKYYCSYPEEQIPNYWKLARSFTLCDNYFSEVRAPSFPNYLMLTTAQSTIITDPKPPFECPQYCFNVPALPNLLDEQRLTWRDYGGLFSCIQSLSGRAEISQNTMAGFFQDAANGTLQNVIWIGSYLLGGTKDSGHPPSNICDAENFAVNIINAVMNSPQWSSVLLILVWDEWGGFYDHVEPLIVEQMADGKPFRYGYRVPCLIISPFAKPGYVASTRYSHVSTLKTIETIFNLRSLTDRDAKANHMLDCLDFSQALIAPFSISTQTCTA
jgi:phospholipase C